MVEASKDSDTDLQTLVHALKQLLLDKDFKN